ncbi:MAG TPA: hypothetical protein VG435_10730 [Acidimicrobiales bacterium]|jgi:hypothetical protein|nr:hypothetical protein [Acidimicrobiales bacterium]
MPKAGLLDKDRQGAPAPRRSNRDQARIPTGFAGPGTNPRSLDANAVTHLQRLAGNAAVTQMLGARPAPIPIQRKHSLFGFLKEGTHKGASDTVNSSSVDMLMQGPLQTVGQSFNSLNPQNIHGQGLANAPNISQTTQNQGSAGAGAGDIIGGGFALTGLLASGKEWHESSKEYDEARTDGSGLRKYAAKRNLGSAKGDTAQNAYTLLGTIGSGAGDIMSATGNAAGQTVSGVTGGALLPLQIFQVGRNVRKLAKQGARYDRIKRQAESPDANPKKILEKLKAEEDALTVVRTEAGNALQTAQDKKALADSALKQKARKHTALLIERLQRQIDQITSEINDTDAKLAQIALDRAERQKLHDEVLAKFGDLAGQEAPSLEDIRLYAMGKQKRGIIKKCVGVFAGLVGVAGGIAATVGFGVALAGATAGLMATPVGWGLAAGAAVIGLGLAGYKVIRRFQAVKAKRKAQEAKDPTKKGKHGWLRDVGRTLAFWHRTPSKRDHYAEALVHYYQKGNTEERRQAEDLIVALMGKGKSADKVDILANIRDSDADPKLHKAAVNVLAAKMAS